MSKYSAIRTEVDGIKFASRKEARRYSELKLLERAGHIVDLGLQPRFPLIVNAKLVCTYVGDFIYREASDKPWIVEDAKGFATDVYRIKRKLFLALMGFAITEV